MQQLPWPDGHTFLNVAQYWLATFTGRLHHSSYSHWHPPWPLVLSAGLWLRQPVSSCTCAWGYSSPGAELCNSPYWASGNSCWPSSQVCQDCCALKLYHSVYPFSLHLVLSSRFLVSAFFLITQVADEDKECCQTQKKLRDSLLVIDCQLDFEPLITVSPVSSQFSVHLTVHSAYSFSNSKSVLWEVVWKALWKPRFIISTALPWSIQLVISS